MSPPSSAYSKLCLLPVSCWFHTWLILWPWRLSKHIPPKCFLTFSGLHSIISQKIGLFITTAVRTSYPTDTPYMFSNCNTVNVPLFINQLYLFSIIPILQKYINWIFVNWRLSYNKLQETSAVMNFSLCMLQLKQNACWKPHATTYIETPVLRISGELLFVH
jgi:hypothetical protein